MIIIFIYSIKIFFDFTFITFIHEKLIIKNSIKSAYISDSSLHQDIHYTLLHYL